MRSLLLLVKHPDLIISIAYHSFCTGKYIQLHRSRKKAQLREFYLKDELEVGVAEMTLQVAPGMKTI